MLVILWNSLQAIKMALESGDDYFSLIIKNWDSIFKITKSLWTQVRKRFNQGDKGLGFIKRKEIFADYYNLSQKGFLQINPIDLVAGLIVLIGGLSIIVGYINLGSYIGALKVGENSKWKEI
ncbi:MAG: hypothetical protein U9Q69_00255 [Nanoarchaeota archaeon]|nr:hypothetical protein [Nanoarchaeota archaeon]